MSDLRIVIDTNVLVSSALFRASVPRRAYNKAVARAVVLISDQTITELRDVLYRQKFRRYISKDEADLFVASVTEESIPVEIVHDVVACRDPRDDKFLELAVSGSATHIITGDADLLALHPFRGISILTPHAFLASLKE